MIAMYFSAIFATAYIISMALVDSSFLKKKYEKVLVKNIIEVVDVSLTSCHIKCKLNDICVKYGTVQNVPMGHITQCFLIKEQDNKYSADDALTEEMDMFVVTLVRSQKCLYEF